MTDNKNLSRKNIVQIVEAEIKKLDYPTKKELYNSIKNIIEYKEVCKIVKDLKQSGKIMIDKDGRIFWTWNPKLLKKILSSGMELK